MMMNPEIRAGLERAAEVIAGAKSIVVTGHVGPDGDSLGSSLALALTAREHGLDAHVSFGGTFTLPAHFEFLDASPIVHHSSVATPDVLVTFDVGDLDRIGEIAAVAKAAKTVVMIDHHVSTTGFGDINVNDPTAGAAAQMCFTLLEILGWKLGPDAAMALHVGMVTDTGRFQYSNTTPDVLDVAARLVEAGAQPEVIGQAVYESVPFGYLGVAGAVMSRAVLDGSFIWSYVSRDDLVEHGIGLDDTDSLIDAVRIAREADVAALCKQQPEDGWKVSLRSRGRVDVAAIAVAMGGGGHHNAAGFSFDGSLEDAIDEVRRRLP